MSGPDGGREIATEPAEAAAVRAALGEPGTTSLRALGVQTIEASPDDAEARRRYGLSARALGRAATDEGR